ncbi:hypothetical protein [Paraburkholderia aspalathi]|uniref:hypothetical protein n=1 Tax=Paraburkholderia aspalathi TaxID=1324617 RepID=UPI0038BABFF9
MASLKPYSRAQPEGDAATKIQSAVRGHQVRARISVRTVDDGVTHTRIRGDAATFAKVGIAGVDTKNGPNALDVLTVDSRKFEGHVVGGDRLYANVALDHSGERHAFGGILPRKLPAAAPHVYINGGYFNVGRLGDRTKPPLTPIGETATAGGKPVAHLPVPATYAHRYATVEFPDQSKVTSGPVLSKDGMPAFSEADLQNPDYRFDSPVIRPGELKHAEHPNPRSLLSMPGERTEADSYRIAVATSTDPAQERGLRGTGFTMPEWANVGARLDRMNGTPGFSVNLDGGASSTMGVIGAEGKTALEVKAGETPKVSTIVTFTRSKEN